MFAEWAVQDARWTKDVRNLVVENDCDAHNALAKHGLFMSGIVTSDLGTCHTFVLLARSIAASCSQAWRLGGLWGFLDHRSQLICSQATVE